MNQLSGILLGLMLISGSVFTPAFAQTTDYSDGPYSSFFKLLKYLFSSGDVTIITNSDSILDFDKAVIVLTSSTTTTNPTEDESEDESEDDTDDFYHGIVSVSSTTSTGKVTLCHVPPGNPSKAHSITVASPSVSAHLAHGDYLGACDFDDTDDDLILEFEHARVITSSNTAVNQLYEKILYLQSNPSISLESLKTQVLSVANLSQFLADADKQDKKEFKELLHDYKEIVKKLLKKADKQSKRTIENILEQAEDAFKAQDHKDNKEKHKDKKESKDKDHKDKKESKDKDHKDKKESKDKDHKDKKESKDKEHKDKKESKDKEHKDKKESKDKDHKDD